MTKEARERRTRWNSSWRRSVGTGFRPPARYLPRQRTRRGEHHQPADGGQEYAYNYHRVILTRDYLGKLLLEAGFRRVHEWTPDDGGTGHDVNDWSRRPLMANGRSYPVSLNLEAEK